MFHVVQSSWRRSEGGKVGEEYWIVFSYQSNTPYPQDKMQNMFLKYKINYQSEEKNEIADLDSARHCQNVRYLFSLMSHTGWVAGWLCNFFIQLLIFQVSRAITRALIADYFCKVIRETQVFIICSVLYFQLCEVDLKNKVELFENAKLFF